MSVGLEIYKLDFVFVLLAVNLKTVSQMMTMMFVYEQSSLCLWWWYTEYTRSGGCYKSFHVTPSSLPLTPTHHQQYTHFRVISVLKIYNISSS